MSSKNLRTSDIKYNLKKVIRFAKIYGINRAIIKASGRLRNFKIIRPIYLSNNRHIGIIGCGQFQYSTISYFLSKGWTNRFNFCYDPDINNSTSLAKQYKIKNIIKDEKDINYDHVDLVYVASNHSTHTPYSIDVLKKGKSVYCEKPISVSFKQLDDLINVINQSKGQFYAGYNRPYSGAIKFLKRNIDKLENKKEAKLTLGCFVSAHVIPPEHWYRNEEEGTRICGNVGHWLDLLIHMLNWKGSIPIEFEIQIAYSNEAESDDNISISITTPNGDLFNCVITARTEPFEGINESINVQFDDIIAKIDDFRSIILWRNGELTRRKYWPKDVGHKRTINQPFRSDIREISEIIASTELMLHIADMVIKKETQKEVILTRKF